MPSKLLKTQNPECDLPATIAGLKPGDFALGSAESRAAARANVQAIAKLERPQPGIDVLLQLEELGWPDRHGSLIEILDGRGRLKNRPKRLAGIPLIWLALPPGLRPEALHAGICLSELRDGATAVLPISLTDIPFIREFLTVKELATLCGFTVNDPTTAAKKLHCW